jgi:DNA-binding NtrC family response regulator
MQGRILVIEDEAYQNEILMAILNSEGYKVRGCVNGLEAKKIFKEFKPHVVVSDFRLPDMDGIQLLRWLKAEGIICEVIIITAFGNITSAVEAIKLGAFDYIQKPIDREKLLVTVKNALEKNNLALENIALKRALHDSTSIEGIVGRSEGIQGVLRLIRTFAEHDVTVLILGETGTGKGLVARAIHRLSPRKDKPFQVVNVSAIPEPLFESELFGHERGAFTGAYTTKPGVIETANGGTLFLDEIGEIPYPVQAKLLRFIEEKKIRRVGGKEEISLDVRLIAATNKNLPGEVEARRFRDDLYYRLAGFIVKIPPLRERRTDIEPLVNHFINKFNLIHKKEITGISADAMKLLLTYHWPGNVRELETVIEKAILIAKDSEIRKEDILIPEIPKNNRYKFELPPEGIVWDDFEKSILIQAMEKSNNNIAQAAKLLGITYRTMQYRLKKIGYNNNTPNGAVFTPKG